MSSGSSGGGRSPTPEIDPNALVSVADQVRLYHRDPINNPPPTTFGYTRVDIVEQEYPSDEPADEGSPPKRRRPLPELPQQLRILNKALARMKPTAGPYNINQGPGSSGSNLTNFVEDYDENAPIVSAQKLLHPSSESNSEDEATETAAAPEAEDTTAASTQAEESMTAAPEVDVTTAAATGAEGTTTAATKAEGTTTAATETVKPETSQSKKRKIPTTSPAANSSQNGSSSGDATSLSRKVIPAHSRVTRANANLLATSNSSEPPNLASDNTINSSFSTNLMAAPEPRSLDRPIQHDAITKSQVARFRPHGVTQEQKDLIQTFSNVELGDNHPHLAPTSTVPGPFRPLRHGLRDRKGKEETIIVDDDDSVPSRKEKGKGKSIVTEDEDPVTVLRGNGKGKGKAIVVDDEEFIPSRQDKGKGKTISVQSDDSESESEYEEEIESPGKNNDAPGPSSKARYRPTRKHKTKAGADFDRASEYARWDKANMEDLRHGLFVRKIKRTEMAERHDNWRAKRGFNKIGKVAINSKISKTFGEALIKMERHPKNKRPREVRDVHCWPSAEEVAAAKAARKARDAATKAAGLEIGEEGYSSDEDGEETEEAESDDEEE
ncbi:hypothetical protein C1H76_2974 [Elsinoe australis]|uniref:Uncharacterized protein n=1 Tax=Elsinoe australis TaxID=40998 RepID=A0A4U7B1Z2_9PEZI|nr:hypothetical protein C1H76_2974 [Elsinoe australis]